MVAYNAVLVAVTLVTAAAFSHHKAQGTVNKAQHKAQLTADSSAQSWSCPFQSRHLEQWDRVAGGFEGRISKEVRQKLPEGCTEDLRPMLSLIKSQSKFLKRKAEVDPFRPNLIPYPKSVSLTRSAEAFVLMKGATITLGSHVKNDDSYVVAALGGLRKRLTKLDEVSRSTLYQQLHGSSDISLDIISTAGADPASYKLTVAKAGIKLEANGPEGFSYGVTTLGQLLPSGDTATIPAMVIEDAPVLKWRGMMLDVSRHFFDAAEVMSLLTVMAEYKMNRFHWHLTDDQGWRLPVPGYPNLTLNDGNQRENSQGSYTEQDIQDVVAFAKARHIQVIPEVDVPGHVAAAIHAYPELGNRDNAPPEGEQPWGIMPWTLAPTKTTLSFLEAVFRQVAKLFPDAEYIHTGGDEAPMGQWQSASESARNGWELIEGLAGAGGGIAAKNVARWFNGKFREMIHSHGKKMAGWDEVQHVPGLPLDVGIFAWRSENELTQAANDGRHVINCNINEVYFDQAWIPMGDAHYNYKLVPDRVEASKKHLVMGAQGQLWAEYMPNWQKVEFMAWPKGIELAENLWSSPSTSSAAELTYSDFLERLQTRKKDLDEWGVNTKNFANV